MSTLLIGEDTAIFNALQDTMQQVAQNGEVVMVVTLSNACPVHPNEKKEQEITYHPIGYVENDFQDPTSPDTLLASESRIVLNTQYIEGLTGLQVGQRLMVIYYFHQSKGFNLLQHPKGNQNRPKRGVFALHSPYRPNPIGVTEVDLLNIEGNILYVRGLDALNHTPILDIKPI
jgi:tRNA-Thr(GGU) m(6)t(6)A37 methyltransferase TsaA